jgi:hypothetical protein
MKFGDFIVADVFNVYGRRNGKIVVQEEDNTDVAFSLKTSVKEITAGQYNKVICNLRSDKKLEVTMTTPKFSMDTLAEALGQDIIMGNGEGMSNVQKAKIDDTLQINLKRVPKNDSDLEIKYRGKVLVLGTDYTYSEGIVTIIAGTVSVGDIVEISPFIFVTSSKAQRIPIDSTTFPDGLELWLKTFAINKTDGQEGELIFRFYEAMADGALDFSTKSARDAVNSKVTYKIVAGDDDTMGEVIFIPISDSTTVTPISNLVGTAGTAKATFTFSPVGSEATSVDVYYKLSTDTAFSKCATKVSTGIRLSSVLTGISTSATVLGLATGSSYDFKVVYAINDDVYESNTVTGITIL